MLARVLSAALSAVAPGSATAEVNGIEAFPVEVEVNSRWGEFFAYGRSETRRITPFPMSGPLPVPRA
jgi:hypothetical protein